MDIKNVMSIIEKIESGNISKFEYSEKDFKILLEKNSETNTVITSKVVNEFREESIEVMSKSNKLKSPIVGTYYSKSSPESKPFVSVGDIVKKGDTVCIIEAMKLFNEVQSDFDGVVKEILIKDGDVVSFDQPIMIIE